AASFGLQRDHHPAQARQYSHRLVGHVLYHLYVTMNSSILRQLKKIAGSDAILDRPEDRKLYEYDGGTEKSLPGAVVFGLNAEQISRVMRFANENKIPVVPRGAGTGLSGGAIAQKEAIVLSTARMNK